MKRGGGRRYYRPLDVDLIKGIKHLLYDEGYTIKGVQKMLRDNGVPFIAALGTGDGAAIAALSQRRQEKPAPEPVRHHDDDMLVGQAKPRSGLRFFGLGKEDEGPVAADGGRLSKDNRALLQEALFDLLECKRLLDQVR